MRGRTRDHRVRLPGGAASVPHVCDVEILATRGAEGPPDLLVEVPHGASRRSDFDTWRARLVTDLPNDLVDYFYVNTDVGAYEIARRACERIVARASAPRSAVILRCLVPRTFIDTNRVVEAAREPGGLTAALGEYIRAPEDVERLVAAHRAYHDVAGGLYDAVCGASGLALNAHTYAPRSISIETFDEGIGRALRDAYRPETYAGWPVRPEVEVIADDPDGRRLAPPSLLDRLTARYGETGLTLAVSETYTLHPASMGHRYAARHRGRVLCLEIRRDLVADPFSPFEEMRIGDAKVDRLAEPLARAFADELDARAPATGSA